MKKTLKVLSFIFVVVLLISCVAVFALTAGGQILEVTGTNGDKTYATLEGAIAAAKDGDTIKIVKEDLVLTQQVVINKSITINLNGKTVSLALPTNYGTTGTYSSDGDAVKYAFDIAATSSQKKVSVTFENGALGFPAQDANQQIFDVDTTATLVLNNVDIDNSANITNMTSGTEVGPAAYWAGASMFHVDGALTIKGWVETKTEGTVTTTTNQVSTIKNTLAGVNLINLGVDGDLTIDTLAKVDVVDTVVNSTNVAENNDKTLNNITIKGEVANTAATSNMFVLANNATVAVKGSKITAADDMFVATAKAAEINIVNNDPATYALSAVGALYVPATETGLGPDKALKAGSADEYEYLETGDSVVIYETLFVGKDAVAYVLDPTGTVALDTDGITLDNGSAPYVNTLATPGANDKWAEKTAKLQYALEGKIESDAIISFIVPKYIVDNTVVAPAVKQYASLLANNTYVKVTATDTNEYIWVTKSAGDLITIKISGQNTDLDYHGVYTMDLTAAATGNNAIAEFSIPDASSAGIYTVDNYSGIAYLLKSPAVAIDDYNVKYYDTTVDFYGEDGKVIDGASVKVGRFALGMFTIQTNDITVKKGWTNEAYAEILGATKEEVLENSLGIMAWEYNRLEGTPAQEYVFNFLYNEDNDTVGVYKNANSLSIDLMYQRQTMAQSQILAQNPDYGYNNGSSEIEKSAADNVIFATCWGDVTVEERTLTIKTGSIADHFTYNGTNLLTLVNNKLGADVTTGMFPISVVEKTVTKEFAPTSGDINDRLHPYYKEGDGNKEGFDPEQTYSVSTKIKQYIYMEITGDVELWSIAPFFKASDFDATNATKNGSVAYTWTGTYAEPVVTVSGGWEMTTVDGKSVVIYWDDDANNLANFKTSLSDTAVLPNWDAEAYGELLKAANGHYKKIDRDDLYECYIPYKNEIVTETSDWSKDEDLYKVSDESYGNIWIDPKPVSIALATGGNYNKDLTTTYDGQYHNLSVVFAKAWQPSQFKVGNDTLALEMGHLSEVNVGIYHATDAVVLKAGSLTADGVGQVIGEKGIGYWLTFTGADPVLTIKKADLYLTITGTTTATYGKDFAIGGLGYTVDEGLVAGEDGLKAFVENMYTFTTAYKAGDNKGTYPIAFELNKTDDKEDTDSLNVYVFDGDMIAKDEKGNIVYTDNYKTISQNYNINVYLDAAKKTSTTNLSNVATLTVSPAPLYFIVNNEDVKVYDNEIFYMDDIADANVQINTGLNSATDNVKNGVQGLYGTDSFEYELVVKYKDKILGDDGKPTGDLDYNHATISGNYYNNKLPAAKNNYKFFVELDTSSAENADEVKALQTKWANYTPMVVEGKDGVAKTDSVVYLQVNTIKLVDVDERVNWKSETEKLHIAEEGYEGWTVEIELNKDARYDETTAPAPSIIKLYVYDAKGKLVDTIEGKDISASFAAYGEVKAVTAENEEGIEEPVYRMEDEDTFLLDENGERIQKYTRESVTVKNAKSYTLQVTITSGNFTGSVFEFVKGGDTIDWIINPKVIEFKDLTIANNYISYDKSLTAPLSVTVDGTPLVLRTLMKKDYFGSDDDAANWVEVIVDNGNLPVGKYVVEVTGATIDANGNATDASNYTVLDLIEIYYEITPANIAPKFAAANVTITDAYSVNFWLEKALIGQYINRTFSVSLNGTNVTEIMYPVWDYVNNEYILDAVWDEDAQAYTWKDDSVVRSNGQYYMFCFTGITPQKMDMNIEAIFSLTTENGTDGDERNYSITEYCEKRLASSSVSADDKKTLIAMLRYGAATQAHLKMEDTLSKYIADFDDVVTSIGDYEGVEVKHENNAAVTAQGFSVLLSNGAGIKYQAKIDEAKILNLKALYTDGDLTKAFLKDTYNAGQTFDITKLSVVMKHTDTNATKTFKYGDEDNAFTYANGIVSFDIPVAFADVSDEYTFEVFYDYENAKPDADGKITYTKHSIAKINYSIENYAATAKVESAQKVAQALVDFGYILDLAK